MAPAETRDAAAMRVICLHARLHPATARALAAWAPHAELVDVSGDFTANWRHIAERWDGTADLVHVDHDVEIRADCLPSLDACPEPWCSYLFPGIGGGFDYPGLGCTRFRRELQELVPVSEMLAQYGSCWECRGEVAECWRHVDGKMADAFTARGMAVHRHGPPLRHHRKEICSCPECRPEVAASGR